MFGKIDFGTLKQFSTYPFLTLKKQQKNFHNCQVDSYQLKFALSIQSPDVVSEEEDLFKLLKTYEHIKHGGSHKTY